MNCLLLFLALCGAVHDRPVMLMTAAHSAALVADGVTTRRNVLRGGTEGNPAARLIIGSRPTWGRMVPAGAVLVIGETYLAERMRRSHNSFLRKIWWFPQSVSIQVSFALAATN